MRSREEVVRLAQSWVGKNEKDGSYKEIIDIYNRQKTPFPRGLKMNYLWSWCACTWSALAIKLGYTDIMPIEISCGYLIERAKEMGIWVENDGYTPAPGDAVLYDWDDTGKGDDTGWPDHVGVVEFVNPASGTFVVIEGNYQDSVKKRTMSINGRYIRGFITPKYTVNEVETKLESGKSLKTIAKEVIAGLWGSGDVRKKRLESMGYDYSKVQKKVNVLLNEEAIETANKEKEIIETSCKAKFKLENFAGKYETTANLYCRDDAGTNKKALCKFPKGTRLVSANGKYNIDVTKEAAAWLLVKGVLNGKTYKGFCSMNYLKKI